MNSTERDIARWWADGWSRKCRPKYACFGFEYCKCVYVLQRTEVADRRLVRAFNAKQAAQAEQARKDVTK